MKVVNDRLMIEISRVSDMKWGAVKEEETKYITSHKFSSTIWSNF